MTEVTEIIARVAMEEALGDRFEEDSKYVIQDRMMPIYELIFVRRFYIECL